MTQDGCPNVPAGSGGEPPIPEGSDLCSFMSWVSKAGAVCGRPNYYDVNSYLFGYLGLKLVLFGEGTAFVRFGQTYLFFDRTGRFQGHFTDDTGRWIRRLEGRDGL
jgi:hypothetical protein